MSNITEEETNIIKDLAKQCKEVGNINVWEEKQVEEEQFF